MNIKSWFSILFVILVLKAIVLALFIYSGRIELGPDEAQYWTWSQELDWGYYSKPPGIAWQIALGTLFFGQNELGVRIGSILLSIALSLSIYWLALKCRVKEEVAFWAALLFAFSPLGLIGSLLAITDVGFLLFWSLACCLTLDAIQRKFKPNPLIIGLIIGLGGLFKWPIYLFWFFFVLGRVLYYPRLKWSYIALGIWVSCLGFLPSLWWNYAHDWATFRHVTATVQGGSVAVKGGNFLEFIGSQLMLFSPIIFGLFCLTFYYICRYWRGLTAAFQFLSLISFGGIIFMGVLSFFQKIQGNWVIFIYPTAFVLIAWYSLQVIRSHFWVKSGAIFSILLIACLVYLNPFKHNKGYKTLAKVLTEKGYHSETGYLLTDKYQTASLLSFYGEGQKRAYFLNLNGIRRNQFSYWPSYQEKEKEKEAYFVWVENQPSWERNLERQRDFYQKELRGYFEEVEDLGAASLVVKSGEVKKGALIFRCKGCKDAILPDSTLY